MSARCAVCNHPELYRVELALVSGASNRAVGEKFGLHKQALWRHLKRHMSEERRAQLVAGPLKLTQLAQKAAEEGMALIDYLGMVRSALLAQFFAATEVSDRQGAALLSGRLLECLRIMAQLTGEIGRTGAQITNNTLIMSSPLMAELQGMLIRTLQPYPEARAAVLGGLEELSAKALAQTPAPHLPPLMLGRVVND
jgi:hypothetical protein